MLSILSFSRQAFLALALALLVNGLSIPQDASQDLVARENKFVKIDFDIVRGSSKESLNLTSSNEPHILISANQKRAGEPEVTLYNEKTYYTTNLLVGSNKQAVSAIIDTGSSDLWLVAKDATCKDKQGNTNTGCYASGVYDKSTSSSFNNIGTPFYIKYGDGTTSNGTWVKDDVSFVGGPGVRQLQFADVDTTTSELGVLGIGFTLLESTQTDYDNLPSLLKKQGVISTNAYSLYLSQPSAATGTIIFGGIDNAKYQGSLVKLPVQSPYELSVHLNTINIAGKTLTANSAALLDSGTTLTHLTTSIVKAIASTLNGTPATNIGYIIDCNQPSNQYISYNFNGVTIKVPLSELTVDLYYTNGQKYPGCGLGVIASDKTQILGDNFLRSAYVAYNLDAKTISLAQVKYSTQENIVPF